MRTIRVFSKESYLYEYRTQSVILCVWRGLEADARSFLDSLKNYNHSVTFTLKLGGDSIEFLDLLILLRIWIEIYFYPDKNLIFFFFFLAMNIDWNNFLSC